MAEFYRILEKIDNLFKIDLSILIKIHPVISSDRLRKAANDSLFEQYNDSSPPINIDGEDE